MKTEAEGTTGKASAKAPGTCGELAQGLLDGEHFLVTCPIALYSTATVEMSPGSGKVSGPEDSPKACRAVELTLDYLSKFNQDAKLQLASPLPRGKGMASSTADVSPAICATAAASGARLAPRQVAEIALWVEPSDGVMFPGIALFDHRNGRMARVLGEPPPMRVVILDFGGTIDTVHFNGTDRRSTLKKLEPKSKEALALISEGVRLGDVALIGRGATVSALANQEILYKPYLDSVIDLAARVKAAGVNVAHSGTVTGMIFPDDDSLVESAVSQAWEELHGLEAVFQVPVISGGVLPVPANQEVRS